MPFSVRSLRPCVRAGDSARFGVDLFAQREILINTASAQATSGSIVFTRYHRPLIRGKRCASYTDYNTILTLRAIARYLGRRFPIRLPNRERIVRGVAEALLDTTPMHVVRRDISSFYESLSAWELRDRLIYNTAIPQKIRAYLRAFFDVHAPASTSGLPRGVGLSATLVELAMEDFDRLARKLPGVYRYFRYADDILLFCYQDPTLVQTGLTALLKGAMTFNPAKSETISLVNNRKETSTSKSFDYLGYRFTVTDLIGGDRPRHVEIGIADRKIKKIKSRIYVSLKQFAHRPDWTLLRDRLTFLCSNYRLWRRGASFISRSGIIWSGIYYNYRQCGTYVSGRLRSEAPDELCHLDKFMKSLLHGRNGPFFDTLRRHLSPAQLAELHRLSFSSGFMKRMVIRVTPTRMSEIKRAWINV